jgi:hypothetical protein
MAQMSFLGDFAQDGVTGYHCLILPINVSCTNAAEQFEKSAGQPLWEARTLVAAERQWRRFPNVYNSCVWD